MISIRHSDVQGTQERATLMNVILNILDDGSIIKCGKRLVLGKDADALRRLDVTPVDGRVILDLSDVEIIDAAGVGALLDLYVRVGERGGELILLNPHPNVSDVLIMTRLDSVFTICTLCARESRQAATHAA